MEEDSTCYSAALAKNGDNWAAFDLLDALDSFDPGVTSTQKTWEGTSTTLTSVPDTQQIDPSLRPVLGHVYTTENTNHRNYTPLANVQKVSFFPCTIYW